MVIVKDEPDDKESVKCVIRCENELENYKTRCIELEERNKKWEEKFTDLELEMVVKKSEYELLDNKFKSLEVEKIALEDEVKALKVKNTKLEERIARVENGSRTGSAREPAEEGVVDLTLDDENDKMVQLVIENKVLECEKKRAEEEVRVWKEKIRELESRVICLEKVKEVRLDNVPTKKKSVDIGGTFSAYPSEGIGHLQTEAGTLSIDTPIKHSGHMKGERRVTHLENGVVFGSHIRKQLAYGDGGSPNKRMAPSTPVGVRPTSANILDISDDEPDVTQISIPIPKIEGNGIVRVSTNHELGGVGGNEKGITSDNSLKRTLSDQSYEDSSGCNENLPSSSTPKRKRASNIITSDNESDDNDDDKVPISKLKRMHLQKPIHDPSVSHLNSCSAGANDVTGSITPPRRRLVRLSQREEGSGAKQNSPSNIEGSRSKSESGLPTTKEVGDDETEESVSDSEGDSLNGFIVDGSDVSDMSGDNDASEDSGDSSKSKSVSDDDVDFDNIISTLQRNRNHKLRWEFEADMLSAFAKDPKLCMKAVCVLYRMQTSDEKLVKGTIHSNQRGFSQCDAPRGSTLGEFLTDGDPLGDLKKSVKDLKEYDPNALELCRTLATHYSKQLFAIYKNKEDPFFRPP